MATVQEQVFSILNTDSQSAAAGSLGVLLEYNATSKPNCVWYQNPPETPDLPLLTYFIVAESPDEGSMNPRKIFYAVTAWGGVSVIGPINQRVFDLLHKQAADFDGTTDFRVHQILFDTSGPQLYDSELKCYYVQQRFGFTVSRY